MERRAIADLILQYEAVFASHNPKAQAALHAEDGVWISPAAGKVVGRAAIERNYRYWFEAFPDLTLDLEEMLIDGDWATGFWRMRGRQEGPFFGLESSGRRIDERMAILYRMSDGAFAHLQPFYDFSGVLIKTGALKIVGAPGKK